VADKNGDEYVVLSLNQLIIDNEGKTGIPFEVLRKVFGFSINV